MNLAEIRKKKKMTQVMLATEVGVTQRAISAYENGVRRPKPEVAQRLGEVLGFDWTRFYKEEGKG